MAHIDNLIERITDPMLRTQMSAEVAKLVERKDFGLVFQRHLPEDLEVPGVRPRRGDTVRIRDEESKQNYVVLSTRAGHASIVAVDASKQTIEGIEPQQRPFAQLAVVKDFSVPIYPGLLPLNEINRGGNKPVHVVIQGENYYVLEALRYTHGNKVDVIYIDPPYNTGADDWIYNDRYVVSTDAYRHSKWLSFMERRLLHAQRLLKDTGVIIVAIGDDEHHRLRMLLDDVFGEQNFIADVAWQGGVSALARHTGGGLDYMLIYGLDASKVGKFTDPKPFAPVNGHLELPVGGQQKCPLVATKTARSWPTDLPTWGLVALAMRSWAGLAHRGDSFPGEGLGEADRVAAGLADMGVVQ